MQESSSPNKAIVAVIIIVILAAVTAGTVYVLNSRTTESDSSISTSSSSEEAASSDAAPSTDSSASTYKDGDYTASGTYSSPGGQEEVEVSLTLANNVITAVNVTTDAASGTSAQYQSEFKSNYKTLVVGKNINEVKLSRVAGSSLTSTGFNDALEQIKSQAV
jgi:uncharacterized protein with FMN-binding domain